MQFRRLIGLGSALGLGTATLLATPAAAVPLGPQSQEGDPGGSAAQSAVPEGVSVEQVSEAEQLLAGDYWTPQRMAEARPVLPEQAADRADDVTSDIFGLLDGLLEGDGPGLDVGLDLSLGASGQPGRDAAAGPPEGKSGGPKKEPASGAASQDPGDSPHVGKIFFSTPEGDYVCSGNLVESGNESTVSTAGHCVIQSGDFVDNLVFAPAYDSGPSEHGLWAAETLATTAQWANSGDYEYDAAFAVLETRDGTTAEDEVGVSSPIAFDQPRGLFYSAFGYPAVSPYDGQSLHRCQGYAQDDPYGSTTQGIPCDMTGGSSGGPWFIGDGADGVQNSVNSYSYSNDPDTMYGPYFGSEIEEVYAYAAAR